MYSWKQKTKSTVWVVGYLAFSVWLMQFLYNDNAVYGHGIPAMMLSLGAVFLIALFIQLSYLFNLFSQR